MFFRRNNARGATMGLVVMCSLFLALLTLGLFQLTMIFGGSQEVRNSVDAGALNVAREAVKLKTTPNGGDEQQFADCVDTHGQIGLTNINRVLGKSFLINANQHAMSAKSYSTAQSSSHATSVAQAAQSICDRITEQLKDKQKTQPFFNEFIKRNSTNMFGPQSKVIADDPEWEVAFVDRDEESNLRIDPKQLPEGYNLPGDATKSVKEKQNGNKDYFRGYHSIAVNNKNLSFVPLRYDEKPHLINGFYFQTSKIPVPNWVNAVPNALSTRGKTDKVAWNNSANAYVAPNPQRQYQAAIPYGFIRIKLEKNKAHWRYNGIIPDRETTYGYYPGQPDFWSRPAGSGTINVNVTLGQQYLTTLLWQAIHAFGLPEHNEVNKVLLQRIREIKADFSEGDLKALLMDPSASTALMDEGEFYIFPVYTNDDRTKCTMKVARKQFVQAMAPWIKLNSEPDGSEKEIATESRPLFTSPNIVIASLTGLGCKPGIWGASESGSLKWTPGTGYDQCLGTLRISRETTIHYSGVCTVL